MFLISLFGVESRVATGGPIFSGLFDTPPDSRHRWLEPFLRFSNSKKSSIVVDSNFPPHSSILVGSMFKDF